MNAAAPLGVLLIADDSSSVARARTMLDDGAAGLSAEVIVVPTLADARAYLASNRPDMILLDAAVADGGGLEGLRALVAEDPDRVIALLTAGEPEALIEEAIAAGADDVLSITHPRRRALFCVLRHAAQRRALLAALRDEREVAGVTLQLLPGLFVVLDENGCVVTMNEALERTTGLSRVDLVGHTGLAFVAPEDQELAAQKLAEAMATGHASAAVNVLARDGTRLPYLVQAARVDRGGRPGLVVMGVDLSERKAMEAQLLHARKLESVGRMAGGIAHDFNNSLMAVLSFADLLLMDTPASDARRADILTIREATLHAADLTRQLLAFSRRQVLSPKVVDLNALVTGLDKMVRRLIGEDVELVTLLGDGLGSVEVDPGQLESVLVNLAVNARDAMPAGGTLTITTTSLDLSPEDVQGEPGFSPGRYVRLSVTDTGHGMTEEVQRHLFEPFFTTKDVTRGTGLGLASVYGFVRQSGGRIRVASAPGAGAAFHIDLRCADPAPADAETAVRLASRGGGGETVLVADDNSLVRRGVAATLGAIGYRVLEAGGGSAVLEMARAHEGSIDLLLADVVMPQMSAAALLQEFRRLRPGAPVLFMSGYTDERGVIEGDGEGVAGFLQKPFTADTLAGRVREILDRARPA